MPKISYSCTCPDYLHRRPAKLYTKGVSSSVQKDWSDTYPVIPEFRCKHIWAVMISKGEVTPGQIPKDLPLPPGTDNSPDIVYGWIGNQGENFYVPGINPIRNP